MDAMPYINSVSWNFIPCYALQPISLNKVLLNALYSCNVFSACEYLKRVGAGTCHMPDR